MSEAQTESEVDPVDAELLALAIITEAMEERDVERITGTLAALHPADVADVLEELHADDLADLIALAPAVLTPEVIAELNEDARAAALETLPASAIAGVLVELDSDDATALCEELDEDRREEVFAEMPEWERGALRDAMSFEEETVGRLMQREFVAAPEHWTVGDTIDHLRSVDDDALPDDFFEVYVVDPAFRPIGAISLGKLLRAARKTRLAEIARNVEVLITPELDQEDVAYAFNKYHLVQAPVVDEAGRLKGMVTVDDIVEVIHEENAEDMLALSGVSERGTAKSVVQSVRSRAPWLLINLGTAILASLVIGLFEDALTQVVALAILMPIVASMGGNAGTQTLAVAIQALAQRKLTSANASRVIWRETLVGAINGILFAIVMSVVALVWFQKPMLAAVIGLAMVINLVSAGLSGILIPLWLERAGADPAVSSTVFVTTVTDVVGFLAFLGLASLLLM
jgi:magnesium transporter